MDETKVRAAITELREHMQMSQTVFGSTVLGKTLPTQHRYERVKGPPPIELVTLVMAAREVGRHDLADIFKAAVIATVPQPIQQLIKEPEHASIKVKAKTPKPGLIDQRGTGTR